LRAYYKNETEYEEYLPKKKIWQTKRIEKLSTREKKILNLAIHGEKGFLIADTVGLTHQALRSALSAIYRKLKVKSLTQAIIFAYNHRLLNH